MANKVKWLGHAGFEIVTGGNKRILIDPWITGNPSAPVGKEDIQKPDLILLTHDHFDHLCEDIPYLVKDSNATILTQPEVIQKLKEIGVDDNNIVFGGMGMNIGGSVEVEGIKATMVQAFHSAVVGSPCGFVIKTEDGKNIYHAGDTGVFSSMKLIGEMYPLELALLPIGSVFVMDPLQAAFAVEMLRPKKVVPMHHRTFPILVQDEEEFKKLTKERAPQTEVIVLNPGEETEY